VTRDRRPGDGLSNNLRLASSANETDGMKNLGVFWVVDAASVAEA
jgi:hypothetical protein